MRPSQFVASLAIVAASSLYLASLVAADEQTAGTQKSAAVIPAAAGPAVPLPVPATSSPTAPRQQVAADRNGAPTKRAKAQAGTGLAMAKAKGGVAAAAKPPATVAGEAIDVKSATGLTPVAGDAVASSSSAAATPPPLGGRRAAKDVLADRWIGSLSGGQAHLSMGKTRDDGGCGEAYSHCPRPADSHDLSLAGVVVKTQQLAQQPRHALDGNLARGRYIDAEPAVYLK